MKRELASDRVSRLHAPQYLQTLALGFTNPELVADILCPVVPVSKQSDKYRIYGKTMNIVHESRWAPGTVPNEIRSVMSEDLFYVPENKLRTPITDSERANADEDMDLDGDGTELVTNGILVAREQRVATLFTTAANYSAGQKITKTGGSEWDQAAVVSTDQPLVVWIGLVNGGANQNRTTFARSFNWKKATNGQVLQIKRYRDGDEGKETDWIEAKQAMAEKITYADAGGLIINTLSTI
jgi:hypothetical protein